jgi:DNA-binding MarR family transcriptional regulator
MPRSHPSPPATAALRLNADSQGKAKRRAPSPSRASDLIAVLQHFRELFRVSQQHYQRIESSCGVSGAQLWALSELASAPGLTVSGLAERMSIHLSTSSNMLDKLEAQGLVRRERSSQDQRVVHVHLTADGKRLVAKAPKPAQGIIPDALSRMPPQALRNLKRELNRLLEMASLRDAKAAMKPLADP